MALSRMSMWQEDWSSRKESEISEIIRDRDSRLKSSDWSDEINDYAEERLRSINQDFAVEQAMRETFKAFEQKFEITKWGGYDYKSPREYKLGDYSIQLFPTLCSSGCDLTMTAFYDIIHFNDYNNKIENRNLYDNLIGNSIVKLQYPTLTDLCEIDKEIAACFNIQAIVNRFRPYIRVKTKDIFFSNGLEDFESSIRVELNRYLDISSDLRLGVEEALSHYPHDRMNLNNYKQEVDQIIQNLKSKIPEMNTYFQPSHQHFREASYSDVLDFTQNIVEQHVLRSGRRY